MFLLFSITGVSVVIEPVELLISSVEIVVVYGLNFDNLLGSSLKLGLNTLIIFFYI